jgi:hypothetical protein
MAGRLCVRLIDSAGCQRIQKQYITAALNRTRGFLILLVVTYRHHQHDGRVDLSDARCMHDHPLSRLQYCTPHRYLYDPSIQIRILNVL